MKRRAQPWLGTLVDISIDDQYNDSDTVAAGDVAAAFASAFDAIATVHKLMSFHDPASDVARINRAAVGERIAIDVHTARVLALALVLSEASGGIFNIGCATRLVEWDYLPRPQGRLPLYRADDCGLELNIDDRQHIMRKKRDVLIDLGGIAKGYAVDQAILALQRLNIASACVNAGGDLRVLGLTPFAIAIRHPSSITGIGATVNLANAALATSATYFSARYIEHRQHSSPMQVSALIDGRSSAPVTTAGSATVQAPECMLADGLTKIIIATGDTCHPLLERFGASALLL
jgi:thiamine biosynthesis lipoprotein